MELLVATWSVRLASLAAVAVAAVSIPAGVTPLEIVVRAVAVAFAFTTGGRILLGRLETPERRLERLRATRAKGARPPEAARRSRKGGDA